MLSVIPHKYSAVLMLICLCLGSMVFAQNPEARDIEYTGVDIPLEEGRYLTLRGFMSAVEAHFNIPMPLQGNADARIDVGGARGFLVISSINLTLGNKITATRRDDCLHLEYRREDAQMVKDKLRNQASRLLMRLFLDKGEAAPLADLPQYGIKEVNPHTGERPLIVMIHGLDSDASMFNDITKALENDADLCTFAFRNDQGIAKSAAELAGELKQFDRPIRLLTHSMGGLIAREYLTNQELYKGGVEKLLMLAPPNHGSNLGHLRFALEFGEGFSMVAGDEQELREAVLKLIDDGLGRAGDDLEPGSLFLDRLTIRPMPPGLQYGIIAGSHGLITEEQHEMLLKWMEVRLGETEDPYVKMVFDKIKAYIADLPEIIHGKGDIVVSIESTRLPGASLYKIYPRNHLTIYRGPVDDPLFVEMKAFLLSK